MPYTPTGHFCQDQRMRLLLASCTSVRNVLGAADSDAALLKIASWMPMAGGEFDSRTDAEQNSMELPRCIVTVTEVSQETSEEGSIWKVDVSVDVWFQLYIPIDVSGLDTPSDKKAWFDDQMAAINAEILSKQGRGVAVSGETHICLHNPTYLGSERWSDDERPDERFDVYPNRDIWFGCLRYEVY